MPDNHRDKHARFKCGFNRETNRPCLQVPQEAVMHEPCNVKVHLKRRSQNVFTSSLVRIIF